MSRWQLDGWRPVHDLLIAPTGVWDLGGTRHHAHFADWCRAHRGARCRLWISSAHVVELAPGDGLPIDDDAGLLDWARAQLAAQGAPDAAERDCAAWQSGAMRGVSVLHGLVLSSLLDDARDAGVRVLSVRPWWTRVLARAAAALRGARAERARLLVVEAARIAAIETRRGEIAAVCTAWIDAATPQALADWAEPHATAHTVVYGHGLAGNAPGGWQAWPGLQADAPFDAWRARGPS